MSKAVAEQDLTGEVALPNLELVTDWFNQDKCEDAERVRFEHNTAYFGYSIGGSKGAL